MVKSLYIVEANAIGLWMGTKDRCLFLNNRKIRLVFHTARYLFNL
jgi:hypothetical protein